MTGVLRGIASRLRDHNVDDVAEPPARRSAVAALLRWAAGDAAPVSTVDVLLMTRAEHPSDPWSGQVALPGGRHELDDQDLFATAVRETREETGIDLQGDAEFLCRLAPIQARARGRLIDMDVTPFAFQVGAGTLPVPNREASELFWFPLHRAASGQLDGEFPYEHGGQRHRLPCWLWEGRRVWGLTYRMLSGLIRVGRAPLEERP